MGRGSSKASGKASNTNTGTTKPVLSEYEQEVESLAQGMMAPYDESKGIYPMSNSDLEAAVEAYAMFHPNVDEDRMLDAVRDRVEELTKKKARG